MHKLCELDDLGKLDPRSIDERLAPYLAAWRKFRRECGFVPHSIEDRVSHEEMGYAGTLDRDGEMNGGLTARPTLPGTLDLFDIKTTAQLGPEVGPQLAGYLHAKNRTRPARPLYRRFAVQLRPDGTYRLKEHADASDYATFLACLQIWNFRQRHGKRHHAL